MKFLIKVLLLCMPIVSANAATITGSMYLDGAYAVSGGSDLSDATDLTLSSVFAFDVTEGSTLSTTINIFTAPGTTGSASLSAFAPVTDFLTIGGWQLDLTSLSIIDQTPSLLNLSGTGLLSGNGATDTAATWSFHSTSLTGYSMEVTAVPVPAALWLFASGLLGLVAVGRRETA